MSVENISADEHADRDGGCFSQESIIVSVY